jgi:hypothetical protein
MHSIAVILSAILLPILISFLHPEAIKIIQNESFATAAGYAFGYGIFFSVIALIPCIIFVIRKKLKAAWISVTSVAVFALLIAIAGPFIINTTAHSSIKDWNQKNNELFSFKLEKSGVYREAGGYMNFGTFIISLAGAAQNNTSVKIDSFVFDYIVYNKTNNAKVVSKRFLMRNTVHPTASIVIDGKFKSYNGNRSAITELIEIKKQLGDNYSWTYTFVAAIPETYSSFDIPKIFAVDGQISSW